MPQVRTPLASYARILVKRYQNAYGSTIDTDLRQLVALRICISSGWKASDFAAMLEHVRTASLLTYDALHEAIIQRLGLAAIYSDDSDFSQVCLYHMALGN